MGCLIAELLNTVQRAEVAVGLNGAPALCPGARCTGGWSSGMSGRRVLDGGGHGPPQLLQRKHHCVGGGRDSHSLGISLCTILCSG